MNDQKLIPWDVIIEILNKLQANNLGRTMEGVNKYVNDEIYEWWYENDSQVPFIGKSEESKLMRLAEEAGGARLAENVIQMTRDDLERFIYFVNEGY